MIWPALKLTTSHTETVEGDKSLTHMWFQSTCSGGSCDAPSRCHLCVQASDSCENTWGVWASVTGQVSLVKCGSECCTPEPKRGSSVWHRPKALFVNILPFLHLKQPLYLKEVTISTVSAVKLPLTCQARLWTQSIRAPVDCQSSEREWQKPLSLLLHTLIQLL